MHFEEEFEDEEHWDFKDKLYFVCEQFTRRSLEFFMNSKFKEHSVSIISNADCSTHDFVVSAVDHDGSDYSWRYSVDDGRINEIGDKVAEVALMDMADEILRCTIDFVWQG